MKRILSLILAVLVLFSAVGTMALAEEEKGQRIVIDGAYKNFDVMPVIEESHTLVPLRGIFETLGAKVYWNEETETVTATKGETFVELQIGSNIAYVNGNAKTLDVPAKTINDRTMVPIRFISESLGCRVAWDELKNRVFVNSPELHKKGFEALDGKKVVFIGDINLYHGRVVINKKTLDLKSRTGDTDGIFYQICKSNGIDVSVTNWCFAKHKISDLFGNEACSVASCNGAAHEEYIKGNSFDYVVVSPGVKETSAEEFEAGFDKMISSFKEANPNTKFVLLQNATPYGFNSNDKINEDMLSLCKKMEKKGVITADWGEVADDSVKYGVKGINEYFDEYSYVVKDENNPNFLSGYVASIMTYCAITGEKATEQPDDFCYDSQLAPNIDIPGYIDYYYYNAEKDTNNDEIFLSSEKMQAFKEFIDEHLDKTYVKPDKPIDKTDADISNKIKVVCVGDSLTYGSTITGGRGTYAYPARLEEFLGNDYKVFNFGKAGYCVTNASAKPYWGTDNYKASLEAEGDVLVIMFGTNDMRTDYWEGSDLTKGIAVKETYVDDYCALIESYRAVNPDVDVYVMTPPPTYNNSLRPNERLTEEVIPKIKEVAEKTGATVIELFPMFENSEHLFNDTLHPNNEGAVMIANAVANMIKNNAK